MPGPLSGPGIGLQLAQNLYPSELTNSPLDFSNNQLALAPGDAIAIPAGTWYIQTNYSVLQYLDPVNNTWTIAPSASDFGGYEYCKSDGFNFRIANLTGCPVSASINTPGSGYVQATTVITANVGNSSWAPIVGGQMSMLWASVVNTVASTTTTLNGNGFGIAPLVLIPAPPPPANNANGVGGVQATAWASISASGGSVATVSMTNPGAGYPLGTTLTCTIVPSPYDPNITSGITNGTILAVPYGSGSLVGVLCTNPGAQLSAAQIATFSLTVSGAGTGATLTANVMQSVISASVSGAGPGTNMLVQTAGGAPATSSFTNSPPNLHLAFRPRTAQITFASMAAGSAGTVIDGGLFLCPGSSPPLPVPAAVTPGASLATVTLTAIGGVPDLVYMQPAP